MSYFAVIRDAGPAWTDGKGAFEQPGVEDHAAFMNTLADEGIVLFAGPLAGSEHGRIRALLIVRRGQRGRHPRPPRSRPVVASTTARHHQRRAVEPPRRRRTDVRRESPAGLGGALTEAHGSQPTLPPLHPCRSGTTRQRIRQAHDPRLDEATCGTSAVFDVAGLRTRRNVVHVSHVGPADAARERTPIRASQLSPAGSPRSAGAAERISEARSRPSCHVPALPTRRDPL